MPPGSGDEDVTIRATFLDEARRPLHELERQARATGRAFDEAAAEATLASRAFDHAAANARKDSIELRAVQERLEAQRIATTRLQAAEAALAAARAKGPLTLRETARLEGALHKSRRDLEHVTRDLSRAHRELEQSTERVTKRLLSAVTGTRLLKTAFSGLGLVSVVGLFTSLGGAIGALGAAVIAVVGGLGPLVGLLGGLPIVIGGLVTTGGAISLLTSGVGKLVSTMMDATATSQQMDQAMAALGPQGVVLAQALYPVTQQFKYMRMQMQAAAYPGFAAALRTIQPLLQIVGDAFVRLSAALGQIAQRGAAMLASGPWRRDIQTLLERNTSLVRAFAGALFAFANIMRNVAIAAGPMVQMLASATRGWLQHEAALTGNSRRTGALEGFFTRVGKLALSVIHVLGDFGSGLMGLFRAATPLSDHLGSSIAGMMEHFKTWANSAGGQASIRQWFTDAIPVIDALGRLIVGLGRAIVQLTSSGASNGIVGILNGLTGMLPLLTQVLTLLTKIAGLPVIRSIAGPLAAYTLLRSRFGAGVLPGVGDAAIGLVRGSSRLVSGAFGRGAAATAERKGASIATRVGVGIGRRAGIAAAGTALGGEALGGVGGLIAGEATVPVFGWVAAGITALIAGAVVLYAKWKPFHDLVNSIGHIIVEAFTWLWNHAPVVLGFILGPVGVIFGLWRRIRDVAMWIFEHILKPMGHFLAGPLGAAFGVIRDIVDAIRSALEWIAGKISWVVDKLNSIPGLSTIVHGLGSAASWALGGRYMGGPTEAGVPYLMGERGPEIFVTAGEMRVVGGDGAELVASSSPGFVLPNEALRAIMSPTVRAEAAAALPFGEHGVGDGSGASLPPVQVLFTGPVNGDVDVERAIGRALAYERMQRMRRR